MRVFDPSAPAWHELTAAQRKGWIQVATAGVAAFVLVQADILKRRRSP